MRLNILNFDVCCLNSHFAGIFERGNEEFNS